MPLGCQHRQCLIWGGEGRGNTIFVGDDKGRSDDLLFGIVAASDVLLQDRVELVHDDVMMIGGRLERVSVPGEVVMECVSGNSVLHHPPLRILL